LQDAYETLAERLPNEARLNVDETGHKNNVTVHARLVLAARTGGEERTERATFEVGAASGNGSGGVGQ
jgi:hypothetical protein